MRKNYTDLTLEKEITALNVTTSCLLHVVLCDSQKTEI